MTRQNVDDVEPRCLLAGGVRRRGTTVLYPLLTLVDEESQFVLDSFRRLQASTNAADGEVE